MIDVQPTPIPDLLVLTPQRHRDARGFFSEAWNAAAMAKIGLPHEFVQDNLSLSDAPDTLRGLHYQAPPHAQGKLVSCVAGAIWDVAVDIRRGSPSFGQWFGIELSLENGRQLWVPAGFLHGFITRAPMSVTSYKCTAFHNPQAAGAVRWDSCGIDWGAGNSPGPAPILSDRDRLAPAFSDWTSPFLWSDTDRGTP